MLFSKPTISPDHKISTTDLVIPALLVMAHAERAGFKSLNTSNLIGLVKQVVVLSEKDTQKLKDRVDTKFDQTVRNLESNKVLLRQELVRYATPRSPGATSVSGIRLTNKGKAHLAAACLSLIPEPSMEGASPTVSPEAARASESNIVSAALLLLAKLHAANGSRPVPTRDLRLSLKASITLSPADVVELRGRSDSKIDQVIRNLVSNATLERPGWVRRTAAGLTPTRTGMARLLDEFLDVLPAPDFSALAASRKPPAFPGRLVTEEAPRAPVRAARAMRR